MHGGTSARSRVVGLLACLAVVAGLAAWTPSAQAAPRQQRTTVTVTLAPTDRAALVRLGQRHHLSAAQRHSRLSSLAPTPRTRHRVVSRLRGLGFRVLRQHTWTVTASAPSRVASRIVGTGLRGDRLHRLLGAGIVAAAPEQRGLLQPMAVTTSGADYRSAYAGSSVISGTSASGTTVATLQFARFDASDLTRYAASLGVADPVSTGQYTGVLVDGGPADANGSIEVALDQEAILATAPSARQRAYFAPNSDTGFADALQRVLSDVASQHITALSISWGNCESIYGTDRMDSLDTVLAALNAQGVTVFASSGDSGIYGCRTSSGTLQSAAVTYPASSPQVVGVGGTALSGSGSTWQETAWSCSSYADCTSSTGGGSGGGASGYYPRQSWATSGTSYTSQLSATHRLVPDIAAVGDPATGLAVGICGSRYRVGGTSLSSPVAAALLTDALTDAGWTAGAGDIHPALYTAAGSSPGTVFRDVTSGGSSGVGYDTVTGLGAVMWPALVQRLGAPRTSSSAISPTSGSASWPLCSAAPTTTTTPAPGPTAQVSLRQSRTRHHRARVRATWSTLPRSSVALAGTDVVVTDATTGRVLWHGSGLSGRHTVVARAGHRIRLEVTARDATGAGTRVSTLYRVRR